MRGTPRWRRTGWLPELEEARWPRLERHRQAHEDALANLADAEEPEAQAEALHELCNVVEGAFNDLHEHFGEGEAAISAARATVTPTAPESDRGGVVLEDEIKAREEASRHENAERIATRPKLLAVRRDWEALSRVLNGILNPEGEALLEGEIMPVVLAQVAETRAGLETVAEEPPEPEPEVAKEPEVATA